MKFKSAIVTSGSGSVGGITLSRNKGGMYFRARAIPTNPNTSFQQSIRSFVAQLTNLWNNTLTTAQRDAWKTYADQVPLLDALGDPRIVPPLSQYVRSNVPRLQASEPRVDDAPTIFNLGDYTEPGIAAVRAATDDADISFDNTDDWANEDDAALFIYASRPQNPTINYFKGPYRYADSVQGDSTTPPTSPATILLPFPIDAGQRVFFRFNVSRADGRLGTPAFGFLLST